MAKELLIDPAVVRAKAELELRSIPVNAYQPDLDQERSCMAIKRWTASAETCCWYANSS